MINFDFNIKCYSCGACRAVCPKNAITMSDNCIPIVNESCVNCGLCEKVCPYLHETSYRETVIGTGFVCKNKDLSVRKISSSGGVFSLLAQDAIEQGWYVCGCVYDRQFLPHHIISNNLDDVSKMLGSKYVKSDLCSALVDMKRMINSGEKVLFSGTPCQIAAVRNMFPNSENVLCVGVVCHGSIERDIWKAYLRAESQRGEITSVTMRDKSNGWLNYGLKITFKDGFEHITYRKNDGYFLKAFTDGLLERNRCLGCAYKGDKIFADILLGDAWGMEELHPELSDEWGLSGIICITKRGNEVFQRISNRMDYIEVNTETLVLKNQRIISPAKVDIRYKGFRRKFDQHPEQIQELCEQYEKQTLKNKIAAKLRSIRQG